MPRGRPPCPMDAPLERSAWTLHRPLPGTLFLGLLLGTLASCASTGTQETAGDEVEPLIPSATWDRIGEVRVSSDAEDLDPSTGGLLVELDQLITAWNNQLLEASEASDRAKFRVLDAKLKHKATRGTRVLVEVLQTGPTRNRQLAAMALGFSTDEAAEGPLVAALEDPEAEVRANAAYALGILGRGGTPLGGLVALFGDADPGCRRNGSWAVKQLQAAGADAEAAREPARAGLFDEDPAVQTHSVIILARLGDAGSLPDLVLLLESEHLLLTRAASRALASLGTRDPHLKGRSARALAAALVQNPEGPRRQVLLGDLQRLAGKNYGSETEPWVEWAGRLPQS